MEYYDIEENYYTPHWIIAPQVIRSATPPPDVRHTDIVASINSCGV